MFKKIIIYIVSFLIVSLVVFLYSRNATKQDSYKIENSFAVTLDEIEDPTVRDIYNQFNLESSILFDVFGNGKDNKLFAIYYKNKKTTELTDSEKIYFILNSIIGDDNIGNDDCYLIPIEDINNTSMKLFNTNELNIKNNDNYSLKDNNLCYKGIVSKDSSILLDTYFDSYEYSEDNNTLTIYDYVAFIKKNKKNIVYYKDYNLKNKVYKIDIAKVDYGFVNNVNIASDVLIYYKDKFNKYKYVFEKKDKEHYSFSYVERVGE